MSDTIHEMTYDQFEAMIDGYIERSSQGYGEMQASTFFALLFEKMAERAQQTVQVQGRIVDGQLVLSPLSEEQDVVCVHDVASLGRAQGDSLDALMTKMVPPLTQWAVVDNTIGACGANPMPAVSANEPLQTTPVVPGVEQDIHLASRRQVWRDFVQHVLDQSRQLAISEPGQALPAASVPERQWSCA